MARYTPLVDQDVISLPNNTADPPTLWKLEGKSEDCSLNRNALRKYFIAALPRFAQPGGIRDRKIGPTSYLDALRGWAAVFVFTAHSFNIEQNNWRRLPFLNILYNGASMVGLFFVISGYVLGYRLLIAIRKGDFESFLPSLASSTFRRYLRLYGSATSACFIGMIMIRLGIYKSCEPPASIYKATLWQQLADYVYDMVVFTNPFAHVIGYPDKGMLTSHYITPMWSIPAEYRGSVLLFAFLTGVCKLSNRSRMIATWVVIAACYVWQAVYIAEFMAGLFFADLALSRSPERLDNPWIIPKAAYERRSTKTKIKYTCILLLGLFLLGEPDPPTNYPWNYLRQVNPFWWARNGKYLFWMSVGAFALVYALEFYPAFQKPFHWRFSQYLGDISFGVYAMHYPLLKGPYNEIIVPLREQYLGDSVFKYIPGFIIYPLMVLIAADYFERVDKAAIAFARSLQQKLFH